LNVKPPGNALGGTGVLMRKMPSAISVTLVPESELVTVVLIGKLLCPDVQRAAPPLQKIFPRPEPDDSPRLGRLRSARLDAVLRV